MVHLEVSLHPCLQEERGNTNNNKVAEERGVVAKDFGEIQSIIRDYFENLYSKKLENLKQISKQIWPNLKSENIKRLNRPITGNEIEAVIKRPPHKGSCGLNSNFYQTLKEGLITILLKWCHQRSSMTRFVLGSQCCPESKLDKDSKRGKLQTSCSDKHRWENLNKILALP